MECCIYEIKIFLVPVWYVMCIGVICLCTESVRIESLICVYNFKTSIYTVKVETDVKMHNQEDIIDLETDAICVTDECEPELSHILK